MKKPESIEDLIKIVFEFGSNHKDNPIVLITSDGENIGHSLSGKARDLFNAVYSAHQNTEDDRHYDMIVAAIETSKRDKANRINKVN